jgi:hypothetical protein
MSKKIIKKAVKKTVTTMRDGFLALPEYNSKELLDFRKALRKLHRNLF